jgi:hypothetical protein
MFGTTVIHPKCPSCGTAIAVNPPPKYHGTLRPSCRLPNLGSLAMAKPRFSADGRFLWFDGTKSRCADSRCASAAIILQGASLPPNPIKSARKRRTAAKLRSWRVSIIRKRGQYPGTVEAPNEKAAEAAAVAEFDLSDEQRRAAYGAGAALIRWRHAARGSGWPEPLREKHGGSIPTNRNEVC